MKQSRQKTISSIRAKMTIELLYNGWTPKAVGLVMLDRHVTTKDLEMALKQKSIKPQKSWFSRIITQFV